MNNTSLLLWIFVSSIAISIAAILFMIIYTMSNKSKEEKE